MKKIDFSFNELGKILPSKFGSVIVISNRAKEIRENPGDTDDELRKLKPTVAALREFMDNKLKFPEFDTTEINEED